MFPEKNEKRGWNQESNEIVWEKFVSKRSKVVPVPRTIGLLHERGIEVTEKASSEVRMDFCESSSRLNS
jgi:hypothetical protein